MFAGDGVAQDALNELTELFTVGLAVVCENELKVLTELKKALAVDLAALVEAKKLIEKVENLQIDVLGIARDVNRLDIASRQRDEEILNLRRQIGELLSCVDRVDQVMNL